MNHFIRRIALTTVGLSFALVIPAMAMPSHAPGTHGQPAANAALHQAMRQLWEDHVAWTRLVIVGFAANLPDLEVTTQRLLRNQQDIGDAIKPYYGDAAGERLAQLLREHISGAAALLAAARSGDPAALESARRAWYANGNEVADFLSGANPASWPQAEMRGMMRTHLDLTLDEAVQHLNGRYPESVAAYDRARAEILEMADMLADGIRAQFPGRL